MSNLKDKQLEVNGKVIGGESLIKMNVKTAVWIIAGIFSIVMSILTYSYFDLKKDVATAEAEANKAQTEFIEKVDEFLEKVDSDVQTIRIDQATIKGDIKLILDRQTRDNPVKTTNVPVQPSLPPVITLSDMTILSDTVI